MKKISIVFTGDEFADGGNEILKTLKRNDVKGSFFFTGNFYRNSEFKTLVKKLKKSNHYLGAHSDKHLLYADWTKRDSLLVTEAEFREDLRSNYQIMQEFGVEKSHAPYFLPPYEWYNAEIVKWTKSENLELINFSPGTFSTADYTYPEMGKSYRSAETIYKSIMDREESDPNGLNGFFLLVHIGTDPRRTDKLYNRLDDLIKELKSRGYEFVSLEEQFK